MKKYVINEKGFEIFLETLTKTTCPSWYGIKENIKLCNISCSECWKEALLDSETLKIIDECDK